MLDVRHSAHRFGITLDFVDISGMALFIGFVGWFYLAGRTVGDAGPRLAVAVAAGGIFLLARSISRGLPWVCPLAVVGVAAWLWALDPIETASASPLSGPFGYANATSAFFIQAVLAGLMIAVSRS